MARIARTSGDTTQRDEIRLRELDRKTNGATDAPSLVPTYGPVASLRQTVAQNLPAGSFTPIVFGQAVVDTHYGWDGGTRFVCPIGGFYLVSGCVYQAINTRRVLTLRRNGVDVLASQAEASAGSSDTVALTPMKLVACTAGDYLELTCLSVAGGNTFVGTAGGCALDVAWQAPAAGA
jgi:hypothetical protein